MTDSNTPLKPTAPTAGAALAGWLLLTFCAPLAGVFGLPGEWYAALQKPSWNPPSWIFGPVWTVLYVMMAVAAWLVWRCGGWRRQRGPLTWYLVQLGLNAAWTPLFFGFHQPGLALIEIMLLLAAAGATMRAFFRVNFTAGLLFIPYVAWVSFATVLNFTLWWMNRG